MFEFGQMVNPVVPQMLVRGIYLVPLYIYIS